MLDLEIRVDSKIYPDWYRERSSKKLRITYEKSKRVIFPTGFVASCGVMMRPWNVGKS
jgi:hypothetical protein